MYKVSLADKSQIVEPECLAKIEVSEVAQQACRATLYLLAYIHA